MDNSKTAKDIASEKLFYIDGLATAKDALLMMKSNQVEALIIEKRNERDANGIIVVSDIIRNVIVPDRKLEEVSVYEIMTKPLISIPSHLNVRYVPRLLLNARISIAPVEENGRYIGMIALKDILFNCFD
jgi:signal-transduction protein with cAMP-binding, CBS, and nucleotidyltransferase domain